MNITYSREKPNLTFFIVQELPGNDKQQIIRNVISSYNMRFKIIRKPKSDALKRIKINRFFLSNYTIVHGDLKDTRDWECSDDQHAIKL